MEQEIVSTICHETVRQVLKKNELKPHLCRRYVIPPQQSAEFVMHMEEVLELYHRPYDPALPVICMDEQPVQLVLDRQSLLVHRTLSRAAQSGGHGASHRYRLGTGNSTPSG